MVLSFHPITFRVGIAPDGLAERDFRGGLPLAHAGPFIVAFLHELPEFIPEPVPAGDRQGPPAKCAAAPTRGMCPVPGFRFTAPGRHRRLPCLPSVLSPHVRFSSLFYLLRVILSFLL